MVNRMLKAWFNITGVGGLFQRNGAATPAYLLKALGEVRKGRQ
jgi:hypothetical protein